MMAAAIDLVELHTGSQRNKSSLAKATVCGCFYCLSEYPFARIVEWTDGGETAICPVCGIDAVLGFKPDTADKELLQQMHNRWFKSERHMTQMEWNKAIKKNAW